YGWGTSGVLARDETLEPHRTMITEGLGGGAIYYDGQFDDARLLIHRVFTAVGQGAALLNYVQVTGVTKDAQEFVDGVVARNLETGEKFRASAKVVVNATGAFADTLRRTADANSKAMIAPSQGMHLVSKSEFLPGNSASV